MQTLWSRAAQSKCTCRCSNCLSSASTLSRRTTTATARRRLRFGDTFTVFYSSIFATAAVADAKSKSDRRTNLERAIAEAKGELKQLENRDSIVDQPGGRTTDRNKEDKRRRRPMWNEVLTVRRKDLREDWAAGTWTSDNIFEEYEDSWVVHDSPKGLIRRVQSVPRSIEANLAASSPQQLHLKELRARELSIAKLVLRLLAQTKPTKSEYHQKLPRNKQQPNTLNRPAATMQNDLKLKIAEMEARFQTLQGGKEPTRTRPPGWPAAPTYDADHLSSDDNRNLDNVLLSIFRKHGEIIKNHQLLIEEICQHLLLRTSPPNVTTYNILITRLTRLRQNRMVRIVLESFNECHIRPDEVTISAMLKFYTVTGDKEGFHTCVRRLQGPEGGFALAKPNVKTTEAGEVFLVRSSNGELVPKVSVNQHVLGALIHGYLKFNSVKKAMEVYSQMLRGGWETNIAILTSILRRCQYTHSWVEGYAVWKQIKRVSQKVWLKPYLWMLQLCRVCNRAGYHQQLLKELKLEGVPLDFLQRHELDKHSRWVNDIERIIDSSRKERRKLNKGIHKARQRIAEQVAHWAEEDGTVLAEAQGAAGEASPSTVEHGGHKERWKWPRYQVSTHQAGSNSVSEVESSHQTCTAVAH